MIPLAPESGHTTAVNRAWPRAVALRYLVLSGGKSNNSAIAEYYRNNNAAPWTLRVLDRTLLSPPVSRVPRDSDSTQTLWMKATAHPLSMSTLPSFVSNLQSPASEKFEIRIAWRNSNSSLA